jgi:hypothetical protein
MSLVLRHPVGIVNGQSACGRIFLDFGHPVPGTDHLVVTRLAVRIAVLTVPPAHGVEHPHRQDVAADRASLTGHRPPDQDAGLGIPRRPRPSRTSAG